MKKMKVFTGFVAVALLAVIIEGRSLTSPTATASDEDVSNEILDKETVLTEEDFKNAKKLTDEEMYGPHDRTLMENPDMFEGDIANPGLNSTTIYRFMGQMNPNDTSGTMRNAIKGTYYRWPKNVVPYTIASSYTTTERAVIADALNEIMQKTCFKFAGRTTETNYVSIVKGNGCNSQVGKRGTGAQGLSLGTGCVYRDVVQHEMIHAIGLFHEQSRADRDQYVEILTENIADGMASNFNKYTLDQIDHLGQPYDYYSIMHYQGNAFAKPGTTETIRPVASARAQGIKLDRRTVMSAIDIKKLNIIGECSGAPPNCNTATQVLVGTVCQPKVNIGGGCMDTLQCPANTGTQCRSGTCQCPDKQVLVNNVCKIQETVGAACKTGEVKINDQCYPSLSPNGYYCYYQQQCSGGSVCSDFMCKCPTTLPNIVNNMCTAATGGSSTGTCTGNTVSITGKGCVAKTTDGVCLNVNCLSTGTAGCSTYGSYTKCGYNAGQNNYFCCPK